MSGIIYYTLHGLVIRMMYWRGTARGSAKPNGVASRLLQTCVSANVISVGSIGCTTFETFQVECLQ